jgi:hypothetical protein
VSASQAGPRTCGREGCGATFTPRRSDARYCSDSCRNAANRARSRSDPIRSDHQPVRLAAVTAIRAPAPLAWEPSSEQRGPWQLNEACPKCRGPLHTTGRGTIRVCLACRHRVTPPGVAAPYERGGQAVRQVKSQRERDLEALALAQRKGVMLSQLDALAADKRLDPGSLPAVEWFAAEIRAARSGDRLTELAELLPESGIRRRHWWQGEPAAIEAPDDDDEDQGDGPDYDGDDEYPGIPSSPVSKPPLPDFSAELAVREWRFQPHGFGLCGLIHMRPHGWDYVPPSECINRAEHLIAGGAVCGSCFDALN